MKSSALLISLLTLGTASAGAGGYFIFKQGQTVANINNMVQKSESQVQNQIVSVVKDSKVDSAKLPQNSVKKLEASKDYDLDWLEKPISLAKWWNSW